MQPWFDMPIFHWHSDRLTCIYVRRYIESAQAQFPEAKRLTRAQVEAMDLLDALLNGPRIHLSMGFLPGNMQFLHNHQILHSRNDFENWPEPERHRHLLRLWLAPAAARPLPEIFAPRSRRRLKPADVQRRLNTGGSATAPRTSSPVIRSAPARFFRAQELSITESVQRIHADYPGFPIEMTEDHLIGWFEMEFAPPTYSQEQLDELDQLTEKWIEDHERQAAATKNEGELGTLEVHTVPQVIKINIRTDTQE